MFENLIRLKIEDGILIDDRGIKYRKNNPLKTIELELYGNPFVSETILSAKKHSELMKELENATPKPNAYLDTGVLKEGIEISELPEMDLDGRTWYEKKEVVYRIHKIEFYHLGE